MKIVTLLSGLTVAMVLAGCADKSADISTPAPSPNTSISGAASASTLRQPNVSGSIWIRQRVALPPDAVLTVILSDASQADVPSKVLSQKVVNTNGKQSPFSFILPFNPSDIKPNARILLSATIKMDNKLTFVTDKIQQVINNGGTKVNLTLVPVAHMALPMQQNRGAVTSLPRTSPTQVTPSSAIPAPTMY